MVLHSALHAILTYIVHQYAVLGQCCTGISTYLQQPVTSPTRVTAPLSSESIIDLLSVSLDSPIDPSSVIDIAISTAS